MIPQLVTIRYQSRPQKDTHRYWVPLLPFYLLLTPFLPFILIGLVITCTRYRINPIRVIVALTQMLAALGGITLDINQGTAKVQVKLI